MVKVSFEIPEDIERKAKMFKIELALLLQKVLQEEIRKREEIERFKRIVSKSKATEKDVEEIVNDIEKSMEEHYSKY